MPINAGNKVEQGQTRSNKVVNLVTLIIALGWPFCQRDNRRWRNHVKDDTHELEHAPTSGTSFWLVLFWSTTERGSQLRDAALTVNLASLTEIDQQFQQLGSMNASNLFDCLSRFGTKNQQQLTFPLKLL